MGKRENDFRILDLSDVKNGWTHDYGSGISRSLEYVGKKGPVWVRGAEGRVRENSRGNFFRVLCFRAGRLKIRTLCESFN